MGAFFWDTMYLSTLYLIDTVRYIDVTKAQLPRGMVNKNTGSIKFQYSPSSKLWVLKIGKFVRLKRRLNFQVVESDLQKYFNNWTYLNDDFYHDSPDNTSEDSTEYKDDVNDS